VRRWTLALLLGAALCGGAGAASRPPSALALLGDGTLVRVRIPSGAILVRTRVGSPAVPHIESGRFLARRGRVSYALDPSRRAALVAVDAVTLKIRWRRPLDAGVRYRGIVLAGDRLYAYGYRPGRLIDKEFRLHEDAAVLTAVDTSGTVVGSWTVRAAETHSWWEFWGAASADGRTLALTWHGGCYPDSGSLCTSGADLVDVSGAAPEPCPPTAGAEGCLADVHGAIEPYAGGWLAATGGPELNVLDATGRQTRTLDSGLTNEHLMSFALDAAADRIFVLATCYFGRQGLRVVSPSSGSSRLLTRRVCGSDLTLGPRATLLASPSERVLASPRLVVLDRSTGRVLGRRRLSAPILALLDGG
jgi:hypothetical protein